MAPIFLGVVLFTILYLIFNSGKKTKTVKCSQLDADSNNNVSEMSNVNASQYSVKPVSYDYNDYLLSTSLEKGVISSHKQFVDDKQHTTTGPSAMSVLSSDVFDVPFVGLRRPNTSDIYVDPEARQVPSAEEWQYPSNKKYDRHGLY